MSLWEWYIMINMIEFSRPIVVISRKPLSNSVLLHSLRSQVSSSSWLLVQNLCQWLASHRGTASSAQMRKVSTPQRKLPLALALAFALAFALGAFEELDSCDCKTTWDWSILWIMRLANSGRCRSKIHSTPLAWSSSHGTCSDYSASSWIKSPKSSQILFMLPLW